MTVIFTDTVRKEAATITAVFPSPSEVMSILVQVPDDMVFTKYCGFEQVVYFIVFTKTYVLIILYAESFRAATHCPFGQTVRETISCQFTFHGGRWAPISEYN